MLRIRMGFSYLHGDTAYICVSVAWWHKYQSLFDWSSWLQWTVNGFLVIHITNDYLIENFLLCNYLPRFCLNQVLNRTPSIPLHLTLMHFTVISIDSVAFPLEKRCCGLWADLIGRLISESWPNLHYKNIWVEFITFGPRIFPRIRYSVFWSAVLHMYRKSFTCHVLRFISQKGWAVVECKWTANG